MWMIAVVALAAIVFYAYSIRNSIKIAPKAGCGSCPKNNENPQAANS